MTDGRTKNPQPAADELQLVRRAQEGDSLAFDELARRFRPRLVHWLRQKTGCWADAEDIAQQSLVRAFQRIDQHDLRRPFSVWLYRIAARLLVDHSRKSRPQNGLKTESLHDRRTAAPDERIVADELRDNLWTTAQRVLDRQQYAALWLRYAEEMSLDDVAHVLGRTKIGARVLLHRARRRLAPSVVVLAEQADIGPVVSTACVNSGRQSPAIELGETL
jgi:RNA polymerase sigma-70 factor, ECF subfamily